MKAATDQMLYEAACYKRNAASEEYDAARAKHETALQTARPFMLLRPRILPDGNKWYALYGENLQEGVCGFGDTPEQASTEFDIAWLNQRLEYDTRR